MIAEDIAVSIVRALTGEHLVTLGIAPSATVAEVKVKSRRHLKISACAMRLLLDDRDLADDEVVGLLSIGGGNSTITLMLVATPVDDGAPWPGEISGALAWCEDYLFDYCAYDPQHERELDALFALFQSEGPGDDTFAGIEPDIEQSIDFVERLILIVGGEVCLDYGGYLQEFRESYPDHDDPQYVSFRNLPDPQHPDPQNGLSHSDNSGGYKECRTLLAALYALRQLQAHWKNKNCLLLLLTADCCRHRRHRCSCCCCLLTPPPPPL